jgi:polypeptide N-acetylgalactosaminyltransferase
MNTCVHTGWLEPMVDRIARNWSTVVVPVIDAILDDTLKFSYQPAKATQVGGFNWALVFTWHYISELERKKRENKEYLPLR